MASNAILRALLYASSRFYISFGGLGYESVRRQTSVRLSAPQTVCCLLQAAVTGVAPVPADPFGSCTPQRPAYQQDLRYVQSLFGIVRTLYS